MTDTRITPFTPRKQLAPKLLNRARSGRDSALGGRMVTVIKVVAPNGTEVEHRFNSMPRIADLVVQLGADTRILGLRMERPDQAKTGRTPA